MRKLKTLGLIFVLVTLPLMQTVQGQTQATDSARITKVKTEIIKRVANKTVKVKLKLHDGSEVKGRLEEATADSFSLIDDKTKQKLEMPYAAVDKVSGRGMSTLTKVGIVTAVGVGVLAIVVVVALKNFDPFEGGIVAR